MAKNLEEVRDELYTLFNDAVRRARYTKEWSATHWGIASQVVESAARTAEAITAVEREIRESAKPETLKKGLG